MDNQEQRLREHIRKMVQEILSEISTTAGVPGYLTPYAFSGEKDRTKKVEKQAQNIGYTLTAQGKEDNAGDKLEELKSNFKTLTENYYYEYKKDQSALPHQKIGKAISEMNKQIKMVERMLHFNNRLKTEYGISNEKLWKRTQHQMTRLEGRLIEMARRLREMRG